MKVRVIIDRVRMDAGASLPMDREGLGARVAKFVGEALRARDGTPAAARVEMAVRGAFKPDGKEGR